MTSDGVLAVLKISGGLSLFLFGMKHLSEGLQAIAGGKLRALLSAATKNRFAGVGSGCFVTAIVQSSSIVTAMVVGFVSSNLMTLTQAISVVIGANIGTTVTAWLIAIIPSAQKVGLGMIAASTITHLFIRRKRIRTQGLTLLGLGFIFFGLHMMQAGMRPVADKAAVLNWFATFQAANAWGLIKCVGLSMVFTAIIRSSSAAIALTMSLAGTGIIDFPTAAGAVFGINIGTTLTARFTSAGGTVNAKRAALVHTLFNIIGAAIVAPFLLPAVIPLMTTVFPGITESAPDAGAGPLLYPSVAISIASLHTGFNLINTVFFLPFVRQFAKLIHKLVPDTPVKEIPRLTVLDERVLSTPVLAIEQAAKEMIFMGDSNIEILDTFRKLLEGTIDKELEQHIFRREEILDNIQREITDFLGQIMTGHLQQNVASRARVMLRVTDEFESISDEVAALLKMLLRMRKNQMALSDTGRSELLAVHDQITLFCKHIDNAISSNTAEAPRHLIKTGAISADIKGLIQKTREAQLARMETQSTDAMKIVVCMDMLSAYTRIRGNLLNIGETIDGKKQS